MEITCIAITHYYLPIAGSGPEGKKKVGKISSQDRYRRAGVTTGLGKVQEQEGRTGNGFRFDAVDRGWTMALSQDRVGDHGARPTSPRRTSKFNDWLAGKHIAPPS
ncbi:hypothetical protein RUND412_002474 [Rhizina undulata]